MRWLVVLALVALPLTALVSCSDDQSPTKCIVRSSDGDTGCSGSLDGGVVVEPPPICSPLLQVNCQPAEKCTWLIDETVPHLIGHIGCAPEGTAAIGAPCMFGAPGATGFDNCAKGSVCSAFASPGEPGTCKAICDNAGGTPMCDAAHACVAEFPLFNTGTASPAAGGVCEPACDPLADNDFDGSGSALSRSGSACGSAENGCYGIPSQGTPPRTQFWCAPELHYTTPLHHRTECTTATGCAATDGSIFVNSCNQGYEPLFRESTAVSTAVCVAFCKPLDCYAGNCGSGNANSLGAAPHRCANPDALGSFGSGEECEYLWHEELDGSGHWLPSPQSDSVGVCVDHDAYGLPRCQDLPLVGSGSTPGAADLGCVSSQLANPQMLQRRFVTDVRLLRE